MIGRLSGSLCVHSAAVRCVLKLLMRFASGLRRWLRSPKSEAAVLCPSGFVYYRLRIWVSRNKLNLMRWIKSLQLSTTSVDSGFPNRGRRVQAGSADTCKEKARLAPGFLFGGAKEDRTPDLVDANDALSQLSYRPVKPCVRTYAADGNRAEDKRESYRMRVNRAKWHDRQPASRAINASCSSGFRQPSKAVGH